MLNHHASRASIARAPRTERPFSLLRKHFDHGPPPGFALFHRGGHLLSNNAAFEELLRPFALDFPRSLLRAEPGMAAALAKRLENIFLTGRPGRPLLVGRPGGGQRLRITLEPVPGTGEKPEYVACIVSEMKSPPLGLVLSPPTAEALTAADIAATAGRSFADLSHDLRSPLTVAKMAVQILSDPSNFTPDLRKRFLARLEDALDRMETMIRETLDQARCQGRQPGAKIDLGAEVESCLQQLGLLFPGRIQYRPTLQGPVLIPLDRSVVWRLVENLVHNAAAHGTAEGEVTLSICLSGERAILTVHNGGGEIPEAKLSEIFRPFRRAESSAGWGLGLAIVRRLVEENRGTIRVESREDAGTSFIVELPVS